MTIDKAIELIEIIDKTTPPEVTPDYKDALKLGVEALKARLLARKLFPPHLCPLLPGETRK